MLVVLLLPLSLSPVLPLSKAQRVRAHLSADSVQVGERFTLSLVAEHNFMQEVRFPKTNTFGDLVVIGPRDSSYRYLGAAQQGTRLDSIAYEVTTFALDTARVPPIAVAFVQGTDSVRATTTERRLTVRSALPAAVRAGQDTAGLKPMTPAAAFPRPLWPWLLGGAGVLALLAVLLYLFWKRRQEQNRAQPAAPAAPPVPPGTSARRRLRRLEATTDFDDPAAAKPFFSELADILRRYLRHRLGIRTYRSTTAEVLAALDQRAAQGGLPDAAARHVRAALRPADLAKFADQRLPASPRRDALAEARAAVDAIEEALRPPEPSADEEAGDEAREAEPAEAGSSTVDGG